MPRVLVKRRKNSLIYYFQLQITLTKRKLLEFGIQPILALVLAFIGFALFSFMLFTKTSFAPYIYCAIAISTVVPLGEIERNQFLNNSFSDRKYRRIRFVENMVVGGLFIGFLLTQYEFLFAFILFLIVSILSQMNKSKGFNFVIPTPFGKYPFEFTIGFRRLWYLYLIGYILVMIAIQVDNFNLALFSLFVVSLMGVFVNSDNEPSYFVWMFQHSPAQFLYHKIRNAILYVTIPTIPILILMMVFFAQYWYLSIAALVLGLLYVLMIICVKYTVYPKAISLPQVIVIAVSFVFAPLLIVLIPYYYRRAVNSLKLI